MDADVIVVGGGLAGLIATCELLDAGRKVILLGATQADENNAGPAGVHSPHNITIFFRRQRTERR